MIHLDNSQLTQHFWNHLQDDSITTVSFDIFETLVFRKVRSPQDIFKLIGNHTAVQALFDHPDNFAKLRIEAEKTARLIHADQQEITLAQIYSQLPLTKEHKELLYKIELDTEYKNLFINKQIESWIETAHLMGKKILFISDMYLSRENLETLVFSKLTNKTIQYSLYVSSQYHATKATGALFEIVLQQENIHSNQLLHIGDNAASDILKSSHYNIQSIHYNIPEYLTESLTLEHLYHPCSLDENHNLRILASLMNPYIEDQQKFFFNFGAAIVGPILWEFAHWIQQLAKQNNIEQINCIMREGRIFKQCIQNIAPQLQTNIIFASRKSTFLPAINTQKLQEEGFNFYNYRKFSVRNFYDLFKLKITNQIILDHEHTLLKDTVDLLELITSDFKERFEEIQYIINEEKKLFQNYLNTLNFSTKSITIDFGGTGSILQNIKLAISKPLEHNALFYMHESGFKTMLNDKIYSFFPYNDQTTKDIELLRRTPEFIEILFNGNHQTTLGYMVDNQNIVSPIVDSPHNKTHQIQAPIEAFDLGVKQFFNTAQNYNYNHTIYSRITTLKMLTRVLEVPTLYEANFLGKLLHDEGYGSVLIEQIIEQHHIDLIQEFGIEKAYIEFQSNLSFQNGKIPWVAGVITQIRPNYIKKIKALQPKSVNGDAIMKILDALNTHKEIKNIYVYGAGQFFKELYPYLLDLELHIQGVIDTRAKLMPFKILGINVSAIDDITPMPNDTFIVSSAVFAVEITKLIASKYKNIFIINHYNGLIKV